jgi:inorganic pyrophosphatase
MIHTSELNKLDSNNNLPSKIVAIIEISKGSDIKYEFDQKTGFITVDRKLYTSMVYPCNYGFIPNTLEDDGDPVDVLVLGYSALVPLSILTILVVGLLFTEDEEGPDAKIVAVPTSKIDPSLSAITDIHNVPSPLKDQIKHFFEHYKELEPQKFVKVTGWGDKKSAEQKLIQALQKYTKDVSSKEL